MGKRILVVDDLRNFPFAADDSGTTVRTSAEALRFLFPMDGSREYLDELWLDFDLGDDYVKGGDTAMPVALFLAESAFYGTLYPVETILIHTSNPVGREAMGMLLRRYGYNVKDVEAHFGV